MNIEVTSVARKAEKLVTTPSAIQVLTQEDIRRSGASSLPEALRLAPNLQVAQVDSSTWAISARGFNNTLANKLLVLIDGRVVYTPLFAGVFWDVQDLLLEDINRIEVISGPGGTLWGANAVNGVINVISESAKDTQGILLKAAGGTQLNDLGAARYGGKIGTNVYFRLYGKYFDRDNTVLPGGVEATNNWRKGQGGFRVDWLPENGDTITLQADGYAGTIEQPMPGVNGVNGNNVLGRWTHVIGEDSDIRLQTYWDRTYRRVPDLFEEALDTFDVDFQHRFPAGERQSIMWGAGYRLMVDRVANSPALALLPPDRNMQLFSGFLQDEINIVPEQLELTIGTKVEHNDFSGFEVQPSVRLAWTPHEHHTLWGAISRAVRSPSRIDHDFYLPGPPLALAGGPMFDSEKVLAYELGYRVQPAQRVSLSLAAFYNHYDDLRSLEPVGGTTAIIANGLRGESYGVELSGTYQLVDWWRLRGGYTYLHTSIFLKPGSQDLNQGTAEGNDPHHQFLLQSMLDLPGHVEVDGVLRYIDTLPAPRVPSYITADARLAWRPWMSLEFALVGQNLWEPRHPEFGPAGMRQEIPRSVYGKVTWRF